MNDLTHGRLRRERRTVEAMIALTCRDLHGRRRRELCPECAELAAYANFRLERCPFGTTKPTCGNCRVHCYQPEMRERIRRVMRHAGPRMILRHPALALLHLLVDERRPAPDKPPRREARRPGRADAAPTPTRI